MTYQIALLIHIISGFTALTCGLFAIIAPKGGRLHLISGKIYFIAMLLVSFSAVFISLLKHNSFLLHIGIFAFFMVYSGYRSIKNKSLKPMLLDWIVLFLGLANAVLMLISLKTILMVFGLIGVYLSLSDFRLFVLATGNKEMPKNQWLIRHIGMMLGAYISTFTAFLVVNIQSENYAYLIWLMPTFIGTPLIVFWTMKYTRKTKSIHV